MNTDRIVQNEIYTKIVIDIPHSSQRMDALLNAFTRSSLTGYLAVCIATCVPRCWLGRED